MNNLGVTSNGEILYRRPLPPIKDNFTIYSASLPDDINEEDRIEGVTPAPPVSREQKRNNPPPLLNNNDTPFADEEIWQWLVTNSEITSSPSVQGQRTRTRTKDKRYHSIDLPDQLPPRGPPSFPNRQPRRNRLRQLPDTLEDENEAVTTKQQAKFTLQDFLLKLETNAMVEQPVIQKAVLSKHHYQKLVKILSERLEEDAKKNDSNRGLAVFDMNEEFDLQTFKRQIKSPRPELESAMSGALFQHVREVDVEHQRSVRAKKQQLDELDLPPSLAKMKSDQMRRSAWRKQQQLAAEQNRTLSVVGENMKTKGNTRKQMFMVDDFQNPSDSLQFYAEPTHFQDSVRTREPFALVNREDEVSPTEFAVLESLFSGGRWLSLKAHFISEIPNLMLLRRTLTYINLSFNCFTEIPPEMYEMENLQILKLRNNPIREIPQDIIRLKRLRVLVLSFCMVSSISASFWYGMEKLILLDLSFNKLTNIPNEIMYLKSLRELNLAGNQLIGMPSGSLYLNLKLLNIANNYMHPLFWRDSARNSPQRLQDMAAYVMVKEDLVKLYPDLPDPVKQFLTTGYVPCDACRGPRFGPGLVVIRPCEYIFGIGNLPFVFRSCSPECVYIFRRGIADPIELRSSDKEPTTEPSQADDFQRNNNNIEDDALPTESDYSPFSPVRRNSTLDHDTTG